MIAAEKTSFPVAVMCRVLGVNRTWFHNWERRAPSDRALTDAWLTEKIKRIHADSRGVYGAPRIHAELRLEHDVRVGRKRVARLMAAAAISGVRPRKRYQTTIRIPGIAPATDLVERQFKPERPNVLWVADITYLPTSEGWLYLAAVQDAYSRQIVGWSMATHMRASLVVDALNMALARRRPPPGLIHHSDHESQGEFKRSSQRLIEEGCDGEASWLDDGADGQGTDEVAGEAVAASGCGAAVLAGDHERSGKCGRCNRGGGIAGGWQSVVPGAWWDANVHAGFTLRPVSVFRGARGDRPVEGAGCRGAGDRPADGAIAVDDLQGATS